MRKVTGTELRESCESQGIKVIEHHNCSICDVAVSYQVDTHGRIYFCSSCGCASSLPRLTTWDDAAEFVNMQNDEQKPVLAARFGVKL